ncbi:MAG: CHASE domain-containing protein [Phycisphaerae bacterium]
MPAPQMHKLWPSYIVLAAGLTVAVLAATYVKRSIDKEEANRVQSTAQLVQQTLAGEIERYTDVLLAARSFFDSTGQVTRTDWHSFSTSLDLKRRFPGMLALGFAPIVKHDQLPLFIQGVRSEGFPEYRVFPPGDRALYTPIDYIEPFNSINRLAFGFDMFSETRRHEAMNAATRDDIPAATARIKLIQDPASSHHADFLIYVPVYDKHAELGTPTERALGLHGFVYSAYRVPELIEGLTRKRPDFASVDFQIFDGPSRSHGELLFDSRTRGSIGDIQPDNAEQESVGTITVASRPWTLVVWPGPSMALSVDHNLPWLVLLAGALVSWLLFGVSWLQMRGRAQSELAAARLAESEGLLRESELRYRLKIEQSPLAVQTIAPDGTTVSINRAWEELWGASLQDLQDYNIRHDPELERANVKHLIDDAFSGSSVSLGTFYYSPFFPSGKRARPRWVRSFLYPVKDIHGQIKELVLIHQDVTDRKHAEEELQRAKEAAEAANHAKDQFLAVLSHELRNPLSPVLSMVNLLQDPHITPEETREAVDTIRRNVELEARLIDDLLDVTRIARGKMHLDYEIVDAHVILNHALQICREDADAKRIHVVTDLGAAHPAVNADPARLQQVCWNLIKNAVKFTPDGGELTLRTRNEQPLDPEANIEQFVLSVTDTGIGIDPDRLAKVFDAFEQADRSITRRFGGLGLGLAITKALVEAHGGSITAASDGHGKGATFTVRLPVTRAPLPARREHRPAPDLAAAAAGASHKPLRILIVEDQADARRGLRILLEHAGYEVKAAATAQEALDLADHWNYDLLISDIGLPDLSGFDLITQLRTRRITPAIALTGFGMEQDVQRARDAGFDQHLTKPIQFDRLEQAIHSLTTPKPTPA